MLFRSTRVTSFTAGARFGGSFENGEFQQGPISYQSYGATVGLVTGGGISQQYQYTQIVPFVEWTDTQGRELTQLGMGGTIIDARKASSVQPASSQPDELVGEQLPAAGSATQLQSPESSSSASSSLK